MVAGFAMGTIVGCGGDSNDGQEAESASEVASASETMDTPTSGQPTGDPTTDTPTSGATNPSDPSAPTEPGSGESGEEDSSGGADLGNKLELRVDSFDVPTSETSYNCFDFSFTLDELGHITAFTPVIDNAAYVHHFVVTLTADPSGSPDGYSCFDLAGDMIWAWAPGQGTFELPPEAGYLIGDTPGGNVTLRLQVHYNNPLGQSGEVDSSGLDVWVTDELRENNAGTLVFGDIEGIEIPPGQPAHEHIMTCSSAVTAAQFPGPINVFGASMHAHDLGSVLWTEVYRDGEMVFELNRDDPFLFDSQNFKFFERQLLPGDEIVNHCVYDSTDRDSTTYGGPGTSDEMCWDTIVYYPKLPSGFDYCSSFN